MKYYSVDVFSKRRVGLLVVEWGDDGFPSKRAFAEASRLFEIPGYRIDGITFGDVTKRPAAAEIPSSVYREDEGSKFWFLPVEP